MTLDDRAPSFVEVNTFHHVHRVNVAKRSR